MKQNEILSDGNFENKHLIKGLSFPTMHWYNDILMTSFQDARYENGTEAYDNLVNSSSPTYTYFYFFNLTNRDEVMANSSVKPVVEEVGPYVYRYINCNGESLLNFLAYLWVAFKWTNWWCVWHNLMTSHS